jgi:hypothetical protein
MTKALSRFSRAAMSAQHAVSTLIPESTPAILVVVGGDVLLTSS